MDSEGELVGLLGHEIAHITSHHIAKRMEREKKIGLATMAAALASIFAGDPRIASAVITSSLAAGTSLSLKYSREDEEEADNYGFKTMTRVGFNPGEMMDLLTKLRKWGSLGVRRNSALSADPSRHRRPGSPNRIAPKKVPIPGALAPGHFRGFQSVPDPHIGPIRRSPAGQKSFSTNRTGECRPPVGPLWNGMGEPERE